MTRIKGVRVGGDDLRGPAPRVISEITAHAEVEKEKAVVLARGRVGADKRDDESLGRLVNSELEPVALFTTGPLHSLEQPWQSATDQRHWQSPFTVFNGAKKGRPRDRRLEGHCQDRC